MKTSIQRISILTGLGLCMLLSAFNLRPGAHSFQVFVDDKLVIERYAHGDRQAPVIRLASSDSRLDVRYNECGRTVSGRKLTIKDGKDQVLKTLQFDGTTKGLEEAMTVKVKDLESFAGYQSAGLKIVYSSNDFPEGMHVVTVAAAGVAASGN